MATQASFLTLSARSTLAIANVNQHRSATNSDGDDATPTDALILKTTTTGTVTYHKQVDIPSTSTTQASKYLSAVNTTSAGAIIAGGTDDSRELIQKFSPAVPKDIDGITRMPVPLKLVSSCQLGVMRAMGIGKPPKKPLSKNWSWKVKLFKPCRED